MTTDFRALCAELTDCLEKADWPLRHRYVFRQWIDIARAALADEPAVPKDRKPAAVTGQLSDEELLNLAQQYSVVYLLSDGSACHPFQEGYDMRNDVLNFARAVLARWGNPAPQPAAVTGQPSDEELRELYQGPRTFSPIEYAHDLLARRDNPTPQPPADGEVAELTGQLTEAANGAAAMGWHKHAQSILRAAELLQRQALVPVAVSERMPEPKDCDADGMCWWWSNVDGSWYLRRPSHPIVVCSADLLQIWLPAHALPLPEVGE